MASEELFQNHMLSWLDDSGNDNDVVLSSCVRLARNFRRIPFPNRADFKQLADVQKIAGNVLSDIEDALDEPFERIAIDELTPLQQDVLVEKQLITRNLVKKPQYRSAFISNDRRCSIMVNEEDHLRVQCMASGLDLEVPFTMASRVDDLVESKLDIAFDERMGYLTSCPTNLGTGLRASVLLHLPGLVFTNNINSIINISPQLGLAVRGIYSNGQETIGGIYQISNQLTLGFAEEEIIANLKSAVTEIIARERRARKALQMYTKDRLEDTVWRSYGILQCARFLTSGEVIDLLSKVRLGVNLGIIDKMTSKQIAEILVASRSHFLQNIAGNENMSKDELDKRRAAMVRKLLGEGSRIE
jgi:protein arginine kinase